MLIWRSIFSKNVSVIWDPDTQLMLRFSRGEVVRVSSMSEDAARGLAKMLKLIEVSEDEVSVEALDRIRSEIRIAVDDL